MAPNETLADAAPGASTAEVVLAECGGQAWLVHGEQHIDDLLGNTLGSHVSIDIIACESKSAVDALWRRFGGGQDPDDMMWLIHPGVLNRARGQVQAQQGEVAVQFAPWSAALDDAAGAAIRTAANLLQSQPGATMVLVRHVPPEAPAMTGEMANLRSGLIEAQLAAQGVEPARLSRATAQDGTDDRIMLVLRPAA